MSSIVAELKRLLEAILGRVHELLAAAPPGALQVTGVLGLAALLVGYYHLRRSQPPPSSDAPRSQRRTHDGDTRPGQVRAGGGAASSSAAAAASASGRKASSADAAASAAAAAAAASLSAVTPLGRAVRARLGGARRVTLSVPGTVLEEWGPQQLEEGASLRGGVAELLRELAAAADLYLLAHVAGDVGQAVVAGALEAGGVVGAAPGQVAAHRLLFCSTVAGKVSLVRQLEPDLHVDGHASTVTDLQRFLPRLLQVVAPGDAPAAPGAANVAAAASLAAFFGSAS